MILKYIQSLKGGETAQGLVRVEPRRYSLLNHPELDLSIRVEGDVLKLDRSEFYDTALWQAGVVQFEQSAKECGLEVKVGYATNDPKALIVAFLK